MNNVLCLAREMRALLRRASRMALCVAEREVKGRARFQHTFFPRPYKLYIALPKSLLVTSCCLYV